MAVQSLYRRYRPRRFAELKGQEHVVRALRDAVASGREGQAYLFSGPRGTGKTTSARILAKVLNCERPVDGEPCCECESCLAVESGTSYDVHELDAASNNGVDAMRDLIERASLGTPGRHRVYILDEVHMLSRAAEAALLKTLEEPPSHVVFVLATTDPQKVSETIRSRTQHLRFRLLPADTLDEHVRWVAADAGLELDDDAFAAALAQGGGSARDTLSAIELIATAGDDNGAVLPFEELVAALAGSDQGRALAAVAHAIGSGRDPRAVTEELIRHLRDGFLSLMAPELVQLPAERVDEIATSATELGAAGLVRGIEVLGEVLVEMRHAPDPRLLLEVALVRLCRPDVSSDAARLAERLTRLERTVDDLASSGTGSPGGSPSASADPKPGAAADAGSVGRQSGRATIGGRARRAAQQAARNSPETPDGSTGDGRPDTSAPASSPPSAAPVDAPPADAAPDAQRADSPPATSSDVPASASPGPDPQTGAGGALRAENVRQAWESQVLPSLKPLVRALYSAGSFADGVAEDGQIVYVLPNEHSLTRCRDHLPTVEASLAAAVGRPVSLVLQVEAGAATTSASMPARTSDAPRDTPSPPAAAAADEDIDLDDLVDAPPSSVSTPIDRLAQAFPGSELIDEPDE